MTNSWRVWYNFFGPPGPVPVQIALSCFTALKCDLGSDCTEKSTIFRLTNSKVCGKRDPRRVSVLEEPGDAPPILKYAPFSGYRSWSISKRGGACSELRVSLFSGQKNWGMLEHTPEKISFVQGEKIFRSSSTD